MTASLTPHTDVSLTTARGHGDPLVHLVRPLAARGLCGRLIRVRPVQKTFAESGCPDCLSLAVAAGHVAARDSDDTRLNLLERPLASS